MILKKRFVLDIVLMLVFVVQAQSLKFTPIEHASFIITHEDITIFVDPVGDIEKYKDYKPDLIIITHKHFDHLKESLLKKIKTEKTVLLAPASVIEKTGFGEAIKNGDVVNKIGVEIEAVAMYNTTKDRMKYHPKGDGNGYVLTIGNERIYIAGDTEDIPEMRKLENIDHAFICMNLPYTMTVEQAISAALEFKPKVAYPYHFRGKDGKSDVYKFKSHVEKGSDTKVEILKWY